MERKGGVIMFKRGQIVWYKTKGKYLQTNYHVKCRVVGYDACDDYGLEALILEGPYSGNQWNVEAEDFTNIGGTVV